MILLLPGRQSDFLAGGLAILEAKLTASAWNGLMSCLHPIRANLRIPIFSHHSLFDLAPPLQDMGVVDAFDGAFADFSGVNTDNDLHLGTYVQMTQFDLLPPRSDSRESRKRSSLLTRPDTGSEKSSSERNIFLRQQRQQDETVYRLHFNRQFLYAVRHNPTGAVVHMGRYYEPPKKDQDGQEEAHRHHLHVH